MVKFVPGLCSKMNLTGSGGEMWRSDLVARMSQAISGTGDSRYPGPEIAKPRMSRSLSSGAHSRDPLAHPGYNLSTRAAAIKRCRGRIPTGRASAFAEDAAKQLGGVLHADLFHDVGAMTLDGART
jgi:hypothetical protein